ncbi:hypothetical protein E4U33_005257 [Claviceps sp. LM78 group G4]|nr:hypothetical protein E4U33_005257 [Claviceps sp. LM78 group G4]
MPRLPLSASLPNGEDIEGNSESPPLGKLADSEDATLPINTGAASFRENGRLAPSITQGNADYLQSLEGRSRCGVDSAHGVVL